MPFTAASTSAAYDKNSALPFSGWKPEENPVSCPQNGDATRLERSF
jgi:hypothetical protein